MKNKKRRIAFNQTEWFVVVTNQDLLKSKKSVVS